MIFALPFIFNLPFRAWEQRKLGEVTESFDGKRVPIDSDLRILGEYPYYGATGVIDYVDDYIFDGEYVLLAEDGANITMRNYPVAYLTQGKFWLNNHAHIMRMIDGSNYFLVQVLEKIDYMKYNTGTAQPKLNSKVVKNIEFKLPHVEEQRKIGTFFKQLDNTIALHQRKLDTLKLMKKGLLQQMFPNNDEEIPKVRFADFAGEWEQRKAGNIFMTISDKNHAHLPVLSASQELGMIRRDNIGIHIKYNEKSLKNYKLVKPGQFVIHLRSFQGGFAWSYITGITSPAYTILDYKEPQKNVSKFWKELLTSPIFIKRLETITYGIRDGRSISFADFSTLKFSVPSVDEQRKISTFFQQLDNNTTIQQNKLEKLISLKEAYLQKMFI
ncbi:restriction endonuclease subunit S [Listeria monocytogenes]|nr:restriction endonuclease subunit S [Listeria monocytogenes]